jgi:uncharacterized protein (DUF697 family)
MDIDLELSMTEANDDHDPPNPPNPPSRELGDLFRIIDRLPFVGSLKQDLTELRQLLYDRRTPRVLAIGAAKSGRTSVANMLLGLPALPMTEHPAAPANSWIRIDAGGRHLDWLELESGALEPEQKTVLRRALDESAPDVIVLVIRAGAEDDESHKAAHSLEAIHTMLSDARIARPKTVSVLTQVDRITAPETDGAGKGVRFSIGDLARIDAATQSLKDILERDTKQRLQRPIPVLAEGELKADGARRQWNIEEVANAIFAALPRAARVEAARALAVPEEVRRDLARSIVNQCAAAAVTIGLMPIPFSDAILLMPLQGVMISAVAYLAGQPWDRRAGLEWFGSVGLMGGIGFGLRWTAQQAAKLIPGAGTLISGSVAGAGTLAMGRSAVAYFIDGPGARDPRLLLAAPRED